MAHFAEINHENQVLRVVCIGNSDCLDDRGQESEEVGISFCKTLFGDYTNWKQTSYNARFRKNYAGIGHTYNEILDGFIAPKPYPSWLLDEETCRWYPPVPYPTDENRYLWNEETLTWDQLV